MLRDVLHNKNKILKPQASQNKMNGFKILLISNLVRNSTHSDCYWIAYYDISPNDNAKVSTCVNWF